MKFANTTNLHGKSGTHGSRNTGDPLQTLPVPQGRLKVAQHVVDKDEQTSKSREGRLKITQHAVLGSGCVVTTLKIKS
jgi:hypothetical protein